MKEKNEHFSKITPFDFYIKYIEINSKSSLNTFDSHIHDKCEIYINLSGDVSFSVENSIYPITRGNAIITRPYEYHHCIYHSDMLHKHFWILFDSSENERLFDIFFKREAGKNNLLAFESETEKELFDVCHKLADRDASETEKYYLFFRLITLLEGGTAINKKSPKNSYIEKAIDYINKNISQNFTIREIADNCHISIATLERCFTQAFGMSPTFYLKKKRLANAAKLLSDGFSVTEASYMSGFSDCSSFIAIFKKEYNITPLKYQKKRI